MAISLAKGGNVNLTKEVPGLSKVTVGLGWKPRTTVGEDFDLDASAIICGVSGLALSDLHLVFFNNLVSPDGKVKHYGDNLTGQGEGDDEQIDVILAELDPEADKVVFFASIYDAVTRGQSFGQVSDAFIRILDASTGTEIARFDLGEDASTETAMVFGEIYRNGADWKFRAIGQGYNGLEGVAKNYGVNA